MPRIDSLAPIACAVLASGLLSGCGRADAHPRVVVHDSAGVQIVEVAPLPSLDDPRFRWGLRLDKRLPTQPDSTGEPILFNPGTIVPLSGDRILVEDAQARNILAILDAETGAVLARFGPKGSGPGEISGPWIVPWETPDGHVVVVDLEGARRLEFEAEGRLVSERPIPGVHRAGMGGRRRPGGGMIMEDWAMTGPRPEWVRLLSLAPDAEGLRPFLDLPPFPRETDLRTNRFGLGRPLWVALKSAVVTFRTDLPDFHVYDTTGALRVEIRLPLTRRSITAREIAGQRARFGGLASFEPGPIALTTALNPFGDTAFATFQSNLWRAEEDPPLPEDVRLWRIVSVHGFDMGTLEVPDGFRPTYWGEGFLWGEGADDAGVPILERYALIPPGASAR